MNTKDCVFGIVPLILKIVHKKKKQVRQVEMAKKTFKSISLQN